MDRFCAKCTTEEFRHLEDEQLELLDLSEYGNKFLSYDCALLFLLTESISKNKGKETKS